MSNYYLKLFIRLFLILLTTVAFAWILPDSRLFFSKIILAVAWIAQIFELLRFLRKSHRLLAQFVNGIRHQDYTQAFPRKSWGKPFDELFKAMEEVLLEIRGQNYDQESRIQYLKMAFSAIDTGILSIEDDNLIVLSNTRGNELLGIQDTTHLETIKRLQPEFHEAVESIRSGGNAIVRLNSNDHEYELSLNATSMKMGDHSYLHITFRDIRQALDSREIQAWNRLTRILTHEIMNSVTPVSSMSETMEDQLRKQGDRPSAEFIQDLEHGLGTIRRRSDGLLKFVENYRKLSRLSHPQLEWISGKELVTDLQRLWQSELKQAGIQFFTDIDKVRVYADRTMLDQVLINLITNSIAALSNTDDPEIKFRMTLINGQTRIDIEDNGEGIDANVIREIFVPFFTTRQDGSGIGLSLSKQIMHLHGGSIHAESEGGRGTRISLWFPDRDGDN